MKKIVIYYNFILISVMTLIGFLQAKSIAHLFSALLFFPLAWYFWKQVVPNSKKALIVNPKRAQTLQKAPQATIISKKFDVDRRMFLKLIGSAGVTVFLFSLFTKKAHGAFFGSVPGPGTISLKDIAGNKIDPAEKYPTDGYKIARLDDASPSYYGFIRKDGTWFIMREESNGTYKYKKGPSNFVTTGWDIRNTTLTYSEYNVEFG